MEEKLKLLDNKRKEEYSKLINKIICDATKTLAEHNFFIGWCHFETGIVEDVSY